MDKFELKLSLRELLLLIDSLECFSKHLEDFTFSSDEVDKNFLVFIFSLHNKLVRFHNHKRTYDFIRNKYYVTPEKDDLLKIII